MKRTALRRGRPLVRTRRLAPKSAKRIREDHRRAVVVAEVMERDGFACRASQWSELCGPCWGPLDVHEPKTRARGGSHLSPDAAIAICRAHHDWTHQHPAAAAELGLLEHSWAVK